ncbi:MAG: SbcC/MukB-like Walker B domain-containing protein [Acidimicrobiales bacterium]
MVARWGLNRAGILNVYQYGDEILHFSGGRLLLRGVNGSGKSTAMNMLLPFLIEADTRRIDAAGDQQGVLRSWMLSGREDPQPVGYLWIEVARGDEHLVCGCGIKANRAADTVSTWWFVTSRRPGVDLDLVENRHPLSADALRATLAPDPVFRHDQRAAYRAEVRQRLFGGADIDQHVRLLHVVRNPRVGDRIDLDLAQYLAEALPQLSDEALDDAAQPLDDLEQHRQNVESLERTHSTLRALLVVYSTYARAELHRRAGAAGGLVAAARAAERELADAGRAAADAESRLADAAARVRVLEAEERRVREELDALRRSPAYQDAGTLADLRALVVSLSEAIDRAADHVARQSAATDRVRGRLVSAGQSAHDDQAALSAVLSELAGSVAGAGALAQLPDMPQVVVAALPDPGTVPGASASPLPVGPAGDLDPEPVLRALAGVRGALQRRSGDVDDVRRALGAVDAAAQRLDVARGAWESAEEERGALEVAAAAARRGADAALRAWRDALRGWAERVQAHRRAAGMDDAAWPDLETGLAGRRDEVTAALRGIADDTLSVEVAERAALDARRKSEQGVLDDLVGSLDALERQSVPPPPVWSWQRADRGAVLAEMVDFQESLSAEERAGLEGAMEASGLLAAELAQDGALVLPDGGLVVRPGPPAIAPLSRLLRVEVLDDAGSVQPAAIARLLDSISTALLTPFPASTPTPVPTPFPASTPTPVSTPTPASVSTSMSPTHPTETGAGVSASVAVDGSFRIGPLHGRHRKDAAEHIGNAARRAALERRRREVRRARDDAAAQLEATERLLQAIDARIRDATALRAALPSSEPVLHASVRVDQADAEWERAQGRAAERLASLRRADELYAEAVDKSRRVAANLRLPPTADALRTVEATLRDALGAITRAEDRCRALTRSVAAWRRAAEDWTRAVEDERHARAAHADAVARHEPEAARLATLEDTVGAAAQEVVAAVESCEIELRRVTGELTPARQSQLDRRGEVASAKAHAVECERRRSAADSAAVGALPGLRRALGVPGLLDAAFLSDEREAAGSPAAALTPAALIPVAETPQGVAALVRQIETLVPRPARADAGPDGVRQSLRQRRADLGSGWDAEDRQADESVPVAVEVNGPQGRMPLAQAETVVGGRLSELRSLLSHEQDDALRNLLQGLVAKEVAEKMQAASDLVAGMNRRLDTVSTAHGIGVRLRWRRREGLETGLDAMIGLLAKPPDLRTPDQDAQLRAAISGRLDEARRDQPESPYRELIARVLDYRAWHELRVILRRPGRPEERLSRRSALSEGEKKIVSYLPLFAAVAASSDSIAEHDPSAPRFVLLDDAFAKVSEDNHAKLFGLLVELDLDFIATSERLWGTHATVPELSITEVVRDADMGVIALEHSRWNGRALLEGR